MGSDTHPPNNVMASFFLRCLKPATRRRNRCRSFLFLLAIVLFVLQLRDSLIPNGLGRRLRMLPSMLQGTFSSVRESGVAGGDGGSVALEEKKRKRDRAKGPGIPPAAVVALSADAIRFALKYRGVGEGASVWTSNFSAPASAASSSSTSFAPPPPTILVLGVGEMTGSAVARAGVRAGWRVYGADDFARGFMTLIPPEIVYLEVAWDDTGFGRLLDALKADGLTLADLDAVIVGFDEHNPARLAAAIGSLIHTAARRVKAVSFKAPLFLFPDFLLRPFGAQGPEAGAEREGQSADVQELLYAEEAFLKVLGEALGGLGGGAATAAAVASLRETSPPGTSIPCSASGAVCIANSACLGVEKCPQPSSISVQPVLAIVDVGKSPFLGFGLQSRPGPGCTAIAPASTPPMGSCLRKSDTPPSASNSFFPLTTCLDEHARATAPADKHDFEAGSLLKSFESALGVQEVEGGGGGKGSFSFFSFFSSPSSFAGPSFSNGECSASASSLLEESVNTANLLHIDALGDAMLAAAFTLRADLVVDPSLLMPTSGGAWPAIPSLLVRVEANWPRAPDSSSASSSSVSLTGRAATSLAHAAAAVKKEYHSLGKSNGNGTIPPPLWEIKHAFHPPNISAHAVFAISRLEAVAASAAMAWGSEGEEGEEDDGGGQWSMGGGGGPIELGATSPRALTTALLEASWWCYRHAALGGYREPWPSAGDFGGGMSPHGKVVGNAFEHGSRYTMRDIYFFGITHLSLHAKAAASSAAYCWRLRRGGVIWYSSGADPVLPVIEVGHDFGNHYGTLFLRVAKVWEHVHLATATAYQWYVRIWDDNYVIADAYVSAANANDANSLVALGRVGEYKDRNKQRFKFLGGGACALMSNALIRIQAKITPSCRLAAELWYSNANDTTPGFDPLMPECPPGRYGCEDVIFNYCLLKALGRNFKQVSFPGFDHVDGETYNSRGLFDCRGLACRQKVKSKDNYGQGQRNVVLHWVRTGASMLRYDEELYGNSRGLGGVALSGHREPPYCAVDAVNATCQQEFA